MPDSSIICTSVLASLITFIGIYFLEEEVLLGHASQPFLIPQNLSGGQHTPLSPRDLPKVLVWAIRQTQLKAKTGGSRENADKPSVLLVHNFCYAVRIKWGRQVSFSICLEFHQKTYKWTQSLGRTRLILGLLLTLTPPAIQGHIHPSWCSDGCCYTTVQLHDDFQGSSSILQTPYLHIHCSSEYILATASCTTDFF